MMFFSMFLIDRVVVDVEDAGFLARRRTDAAGELGEVVGRVEHRESVFPVIAVHQVVEVRNDVVDRAAAVAERRAAVHAARALDLGLRLVEADHEFLVVLDPLLDRLVALLDALMLHEAGDFSHRDSLVRPRCLLTSCSRLPPSGGSTSGPAKPVPRCSPQGEKAPTASLHGA